MLEKFENAKKKCIAFWNRYYPQFLVWYGYLIGSTPVEFVQEIIYTWPFLMEYYKIIWATWQVVTEFWQWFRVFLAIFIFIAMGVFDGLYVKVVLPWWDALIFPRPPGVPELWDRFKDRGDTFVYKHFVENKNKDKKK